MHEVKRVLVTGGAGFIGSFLCERLLEQDQADFYRNIHVHGIGLLQFEALEEAADVGYRESIGPLREWLEGRPDLLAGKN